MAMAEDEELGRSMSHLYTYIRYSAAGIQARYGNVSTPGDAIYLWERVTAARIALERHFSLSDQLMRDAIANGQRARYTFDVCDRDGTALRRITVEGEIGAESAARVVALEGLSNEELPNRWLARPTVEIFTPAPATT